MKKIYKTFIFASLLLTAGLSFAQSGGKASDFSAQKANRQTALRYLKLAKNYAIQGDWKKTLAAATAGNNYDATVADLWYLIALSQYNEGATRKAVLPVLKNSLDGAVGVD